MADRKNPEISSISPDKRINSQKELLLGSISITPQEYTIGHIGNKLGIVPKWLENHLQHNTISPTVRISGKNKIIEDIRWGEPRLDDCYSLVKKDGEYQLHRLRGQKDMYIVVPIENIIKGSLEIKTVLSELKDTLPPISYSLDSQSA